MRGTHDRSAAGGDRREEKEKEEEEWGAQNLDSSLSLPLGTNIEQDRAKCCCLRATVFQNTFSDPPAKTSPRTLMDKRLCHSSISA